MVRYQFYCKNKVPNSSRSHRKQIPCDLWFLCGVAQNRNLELSQRHFTAFALVLCRNVRSKMSPKFKCPSTSEGRVLQTYNRIGSVGKVQLFTLHFTSSFLMKKLRVHQQWKKRKMGVKAKMAFRYVFNLMIKNVV